MIMQLQERSLTWLKSFSRQGMEIFIKRINYIWLHTCTKVGGYTSKRVAYLSQLELEIERDIIQGNEGAASHPVISIFTLFFLMILLVTPVQSM